MLTDKVSAGDYSRRERKYPVGAELRANEIDFRIWAPHKTRAELVLSRPRPETIAMQSEGQGYFSCRIVNPGLPVLYQFRLDEHEKLLADPASRFQPAGPKGPSEVIDPATFKWVEPQWQGITFKKPLLYEMHVGTFTHEGTWAAATRHLPELAYDGIRIIELMPIADFTGRFGWGYDGANLFAPFRMYGRPDELKLFINSAHQLKLGVILDVVYNHLGPDNVLPLFSEHYFSDRYACEWGDAVNYDGPFSGPVREFFLANIRYWIEEYHFDGFRIDATQQIFDSSQPHIIAQMTEQARNSAGSKTIYITGENEPQKRILLEPVTRQGGGLDALWNDDFHHCMRGILAGRNEAYLSDYSGHAQEIVSAAKYGCLYQGQFSRWQQDRRGTDFRGIHHSRFICYLQNHDQVANSAWGYRLGELTSAARGRAAIALLLLGPWTPMIFQGQEFNASTPFLYFADHPFPFSQEVSKGRKQFLSQFPGIATEPMQNALQNPSLEETFLKSKLDHSERTRNRKFREMFQCLSCLRTSDAVLSAPDMAVDGAVLGASALVLRCSSAAGERLILVNLGPNLMFSPAPEPLLASPENQHWSVVFSTEDPQYGGSGTPEVELLNGWRVPAECTLLLSPVE